MSNVNPNNLVEGSAPRRQTIAVQQIGASLDKTGANMLSVAIAALGAGTPFWLSSPVVRGKGRIVRVFGGHLTTGLTGDSTMDIVPYIFRPSLGAGKDLTGADCSVCPVLASPGLRLTSALAAGAFAEVIQIPELEVVELLQAPGGANQVKLAAADAAPDGAYVTSEILILEGLGKGQRNILKTFENATKIAKVLNAEGSLMWKVATDATSLARIRTRRSVVQKGDQILFAVDFTVGTGAAGADCVAGVEIEFDDDVDV